LELGRYKHYLLFHLLFLLHKNGGSGGVWRSNQTWSTFGMESRLNKNKNCRFHFFFLSAISVFTQTARHYNDIHF